MRILIAFDVRLEEGRNYAQDDVAALLGETIEGDIKMLYMGDERDTRYRIEHVTVL